MKMTTGFRYLRKIALVVEEGLRIHLLSEGSFDITIGPLVNLWGFGPKGGQDEVPNPDDIMDAMARVGSRRLQVRLSPPALKKNRSDLYVDLSGIAKGFAVDELARHLDSAGITGYMVDIGGELKTRGRKKDGSSMSEAPSPTARHASRTFWIAGKSAWDCSLPRRCQPATNRWTGTSCR